MSYTGMIAGQSYPTQVTIQGDTSGDPLNAVAYRWDAPVAAGPQTALTVNYGGGVYVRGFAFDNRTAVAADVTSAGIFINVGSLASVWLDNVVFLYNGGVSYLNCAIESYCVVQGNIGIFAPTTTATGSTTNTFTTVGVSGISGPPIMVGSGVSGTGIPAGAYVTAINANPPTSITISAAATATGSPTLTFTDSVLNAFGVGEVGQLSMGFGGDRVHYISLSGNPRMVAGFINLDKGFANWYGVPVFQAETLQPLTTTSASTGSKQITVNTTTGIAPGYLVVAPFAPLGTTVDTVDDATHFTMTEFPLVNVSTPTATKVGSAPAQINGPQMSLWSNSVLSTSGTSAMIPGTAYIIGGAQANGSVTSGSQIDDLVRTVTGPNTSTANYIPKWSNTRDLLADSGSFFVGTSLALSATTGSCFHAYYVSSTNRAGLCANSSGHMTATLGQSSPVEAGGWLTNGDFRLNSGAALATNATAAFALAPGMAGTASGAPTNAAAGAIPFVYDTTNNRPQWYNSGWKQTAMVADIGSTIQAWDADLDAIAALSSTGIAVRSASNTWVQRTIAGTAAEITATNGDGVSGNPTLSLPTALTFTGKTVTGGTFATITASGTWAASGTWTIPAVTLGGTVSGGGNQINNVIIGTSTPLAGSFTTLSASTSVTSPLVIGGSGTTGTQLTFKTTTGNGTTDQFAWVGGNNGATSFATMSAANFAVTLPQLSLTYGHNAITYAVVSNANAGASAGAAFFVGSDKGNFTFTQYSVAAGGATIQSVPADGAMNIDLPGATGGVFTIRNTNSYFTRFSISVAGVVTMPANVAATSATTGTNVITGGLGVSGAGWFGTYVATGVVAVGSLPACGAGIKGARMFVTDANATTFASTVAAGGANNVPVVCDGTNWIIGSADLDLPQFAANDNTPAFMENVA